MKLFHWGKTAAKVSGLKDWRDHDARQTWSDEGDAEKLLNEFLPKVQEVIASNVKLGVADYAASGEYALSVRENTLWVDLRIWNDKSTLVVGVPLRDLLNAGIAEAYKTIGANQHAQEFVSHIHNLARDLTRLSQTPSKPQSVAQPARRIATRQEVA